MEKPFGGTAIWGNSDLAEQPFGGEAIWQRSHLAELPFGTTMIYPNNYAHDALALAPPISGRKLPQNQMPTDLPNEV